MWTRVIRLPAAHHGYAPTRHRPGPVRSRRRPDPAVGQIVAEFFDLGQSRSLPWKRRPQAALLLEALKDPGRGFDAVVIGEPHRAFYGNQFSLIFPLFEHYGVQLWVPEVGGAVDPASEAHDLVMSVFGGMSKGERNRIKIRVRSAMQAQTKVEGRYLGGRPPYGYRLVDAGPQPNPAKAAAGKRLHVLELDPVIAPVVARIFRDYLNGIGIWALAERLTAEGIPCPSAHDPGRNRHRSGIASSKGAIRAILRNPRYTGYQVWNKQRNAETRLDVEDVALGYETKLRWNDTSTWVWSDRIAHPPIIDKDTCEQAGRRLASRGPASTGRTVVRTRHSYALTGVLFHAQCGRRMQGSWNNRQAHYRCRFPSEYAIANKLDHPVTVYLRETNILEPLDGWLRRSTCPAFEHSLTALERAQPDIDARAEAVRRTLDECDRKLARHRAALEAGADPALVAAWSREVQAQRVTAQAQLATIRTQPGTGRRMTRDEIRSLVDALGGLLRVLRDADPGDKLEVYRQLGLRLTYHHDSHTVLAETRPPPSSMCAVFVSEGDLNTQTGEFSRVRGKSCGQITLPRQHVKPVPRDGNRY